MGILRARERRGTPADLLVVGLRNPGRDYQGTRHNLGFEVVELLARRHGERLSASRQHAEVAELRIDGRRVAVAAPTTYMNDSGRSVQALAARHGIDDPARLVVVHDELDLPVGRLRVKVGGGVAGHNGLRSIAQHLSTRDFVRVRIGIGKPPDPRRGADHVLRRPGKAERTELDVVVEEAADAVETVGLEGVERAMTRFNAPRPA